MSEREVRVNVLVWRPRDPRAPGDLAAGWPRVLQVRSARTVWQVPGVVLRPYESVMAAAGRAAYALGLELPTVHRALTIDQRPALGRHPEQLVIVVDGGWTDGEDVRVVSGSRFPRSAGCLYECRWAEAEDLAEEIAVATALSAALGKTPAFIVNQPPAGACHGEGG
ncbi:hypothetical protein [Streptomyces sp. NPDC057702]|uniref:hypothetical protein n=1 Tax=unclassified Streptomyces TaxID=2593676 RepID=UPI003690562C